ncbi:MAG: hypothetical protein Q8R79_04455 [Legionellaceae bacterium]|nr:hypothetical protein [Legionellaceae bacterium]
MIYNRMLVLKPSKQAIRLWQGLCLFTGIVGFTLYPTWALRGLLSLLLFGVYRYSVFLWNQERLLYLHYLDRQWHGENAAGQKKTYQKIEIVLHGDFFCVLRGEGRLQYQVLFQDQWDDSDWRYFLWQLRC